MLYQVGKSKIIESSTITCIVKDGEKFRVTMNGNRDIELTKEEGDYLLNKLTIFTPSSTLA